MGEDLGNTFGMDMRWTWAEEGGVCVCVCGGGGIA